MRRSVRSKSARSASSKSGSCANTAKPNNGSLATPAALYIHVPFCVVKCGYCDFNSFADSSQAEMDRVLEAMITELAEHRGLRPRTVFLGGGTPTFLGAAQLEKLLEAIHSYIDLSDVTEFSCEANPESCTAEKTQILTDKSVTRFSIGFQSLDPDRLAFLDRAHDVAQSLRAYEAARATGARVSVDLIFAVPGQNLDAWTRELEQVLALEPDHLSCYHLTFEAGTRLYAERARGSVKETSPELGRELLLETRRVVGDAGLRAYEVSNFARPGQECQHNVNYWRGGNYIGVGPGAASHRDGHRWTNLRPLERYSVAVEETGSGAQGAEVLTPDHRCREAIWLGLRMSEGADLDAIRERTGVDPHELCRDAIHRALADGHCVLRDARHLCLQEHALPFTDSVAASFL